MTKISYKKSQVLWNDSQKYIAPGSSTISKHPKLCTMGAYPIYAESGKGSVITDVDNNKYIDFQSALGAIILGMCNAEVSKNVSKQLARGTLFSLSTPLQIELAKEISKIIPSAEKMRFLKNGSDATSAAIRIARAYTGKTMILSCHFHGWHDWFYTLTTTDRGIPKKLKKDIIEFEYNNITSLEKIFSKYKNKIAAVIMEPACLEAPKKGYLEEVKKIVHKNEALLIFDEVVTGFRFSLGGAQAYFGVTPDLSCFGKALANGYPLSIVAGSKKIMDNTEDVITSITYGEEALSFAASLATIKLLKSKPVYDHIWKLGEYFSQEYNKLSVKYGLPTECIGYPVRLQLQFSDFKKHERLQLKAFFLQETAKRGVLFGNMIFMTYSHTLKQVKDSIGICEAVFKQMSQAVQNNNLRLDGEPTKELW